MCLKTHPELEGKPSRWNLYSWQRRPQPCLCLPSQRPSEDVPRPLASWISVGPPSRRNIAEKDIFDDCSLAIFNTLITYVCTRDMPPLHRMASFNKEASNICRCSLLLSFTGNCELCLIFFGNLFEVIPVKLGIFLFPQLSKLLCIDRTIHLLEQLSQDY